MNGLKKIFGFLTNKKDKKMITKACEIYKNSKQYKIITQSKTNTGLFISDNPIYILPVDIDLDLFKEHIFSALNSSRQNVKMPPTHEDIKLWQRQLLKSMREKSFSSFYKNSTNCDIIWNLDDFIISPGKYSQEYRGLVTVEEDVIELKFSQTTELEITKKVIKILEKEYDWW